MVYSSLQVPVFKGEQRSRSNQEMLAKLLLLFLICICTFPRAAEGKNMVFIPMSVSSHIRSHVNIVGEMQKLGHRSWVCVPENIVNATWLNKVNVIPYGNQMEDLEESMLFKSGLMDNYWAGKEQDMSVLYKIGSASWRNSLDMLSDANLWAGIEAVKPDLIILDWTPFCKVMLAVPYRLNVPFAFIGPFHDVVNAKVPHTSACNPDVISDLNDKMNFMERVKNTLLQLSLMIYNPFCNENIIHDFVPEKPPITISSLSTKAEIFLIETDHILDYARPMLPNTKLIGGTAATPSKPLQEPFKSFMDKSTQGAIVVTFGSIILNLPANIYEKMISSFAKLDLNVVWRNNLSLPESENILTSSWIPQNDLLGHNHTRVFVSHCGLNGQYEALYNGVPILCLPLFADQFHNARRIVNKGFGLRADIRTLSADELADAIKDIAYNNTYRENIKKASSLFRKLYKEPRKAAAFWLDHVVKFGGSYMRFAGQDMPLYRFLLVDVYGFLIGATLILCMTLFVFFKFTLHLFAKSKKNKID